MVLWSICFVFVQGEAVQRQDEQDAAWWAGRVWGLLHLCLPQGVLLLSFLTGCMCSGIKKGLGPFLLASCASVFNGLGHQTDWAVVVMQRCGSGMCVPDFFPSRIRTVSIPEPGSASKNLSILTPKKWFLSSRKYNPGCLSRIRMLTFYPSRIQGSKRHRIPDLDPQHCCHVLIMFAFTGRNRFISMESL